MTQSPYNWLEAETEGNALVVRFLTHAIVDERVIRIVAEELFRLAEAGHKNLVLDFEEVKHLSSSILATLIKLNKHLQDCRGQLRLCSIDADIMPVFEVTHLNKVLRILPDRAEAIASL